MVLGARPIGLLAGMLFRLEGLIVHFYDATKPGLKRDLAVAMGASYVWASEHSLSDEPAAEIGPVDIIFEAPGFSPLAFDAMDMAGPNGVICLTDVSGASRVGRGINHPYGVSSMRKTRAGAPSAPTTFRGAHTSK